MKQNISDTVTQVAHEQKTCRLDNGETSMYLFEFPLPGLLSCEENRELIIYAYICQPFLNAY